VRRAAVIAVAGSIVLSVTGCAPLQSASSPSTATVASGVVRAERSHEYPAAPGSGSIGEKVRAPSRDPVRAIQAFAVAYINWTAATVTAQLRTLAALSVGQARAAMTVAASETARDYELRRGGVANAGRVEAVAPVIGRQHQYAVVTREQTTARASDAYRGLRPAWHVALVTVTRVGVAGWAVSGWQPEN
jgi:hypothetical protein